MEVGSTEINVSFVIMFWVRLTAGDQLGSFGSGAECLIT